jgi:hypothetical protein
MIQLSHYQDPWATGPVVLGVGSAIILTNWDLLELLTVPGTATLQKMVPQQSRFLAVYPITANLPHIFEKALDCIGKDTENRMNVK